MPRRNRRRNSPDPVSYDRLLADLRDAWAVRMGAAWRDVKQARREGIDPSTPAFGRFLKERRLAAQEREASRPVSVDDARAALSAYLA